MQSSLIDCTIQTANPNNLYVFGIDDASLPSFAAQQIVPEPPTTPLILGSLGAMGLMLRRKGQH